MTVFRTGSVSSLSAWHDRASGSALFSAAAVVFLLCLFSIDPVGAKQDRVALVIGNSSYTEAPLRNPVNDARAMSIALRGLGFYVIAVEDADQRKMQAAVLRFAERLDGQDTGLFYYAGHGIQVDGRNYLVPLGAELPSALSVEFQAMSVESVLKAMERAGNRINLVVLDACRNNPFERRFRGMSRGLAAIDAARGTLIAYATAPGSVAADGTGRNGLYTEAVLNAFAVPGLKVEEVFKQVRIEVSNRSNGQQIPWESSSLTGDFFFNPSKQTAQPVMPEGPDREALFWESIKDSRKSADFRAYLAQFPNGFFATLARNRLAELRRTGTETKDTVEPVPVPPETAAFDPGRLRFIPGEYAPRQLAATGVCGQVRLGKMQASEDVIEGIWNHPQASGTVTMRQEDGIVGVQLRGDRISGKEGTVQIREGSLFVRIKVQHPRGNCTIAYYVDAIVAR